MIKEATKVTIDRVSGSGNPIAAEEDNGKLIIVPGAKKGDTVKIKLLRIGTHRLGSIVNPTKSQRKRAKRQLRGTGLEYKHYFTIEKSEEELRKKRRERKKRGKSISGSNKLEKSSNTQSSDQSNETSSSSSADKANETLEIGEARETGQRGKGIQSVPESSVNLKIGGKYLRKELHDQFKGQRQHGISTPAAHPVVFLFTDTSSEEHGYSGEFLDNGMFVYSGEGQQGDTTLDGGNKRILEHEENGDSLYVFERVEEVSGADVVTFDGEYEYVDHHWEKAPDDNDTMRKALRFKLAPVGGVEADISKDTADQLSLEDLFQKARESAGGSSSKPSRSTTSSAGGSSYSRSELVRDCALRMADGVCQGCENEAPFVGKDGKPFLEVHHMHRRSDGGLDVPENVIAICPNCHREVHHGEIGEKLNEQLIQRAATRNDRFG